MPWPVYKVCLNDWPSLNGRTMNCEDSRGWNAANCAVKFAQESTVSTTVLRTSGNGDARSHFCAKVTELVPKKSRTESVLHPVNLKEHSRAMGPTWQDSNSRDWGTYS